MDEPASAIIVAFPIPRRIEAIRREHVSVARLGVPPHVTILSPFLPAAGLDPPVRQRLAGIARGLPSFGVQFRAVRRFPDALYLEPEPAAPFRRLVRDVCAAFPGHPPYGDPAYLPDSIVPHLTIAIGDRSAFDRLAALAARFLPISLAARNITVVAERTDGRWRTVWRLPLRP
jgi:2'-5' RNA ligase